MQLIQKIVFSVYKPIVAKKIYRTSYYKWQDITLRIPPGVFHPKYFFSTKFLLETVLAGGVNNKTLLELGAGSGLISIACAKQGAIVTASDISKRVVDALEENSLGNHVELKVIHSDLFQSIPAQQFDIIAINPPYYPKNPRNELEQAWYCGEGYEYFEKMFLQLGKYMHDRSAVLMVLSEDCNLDTIFRIAEKNGFTFIQKIRKKFYWEWNIIFEIQKIERK